MTSKTKSQLEIIEELLRGRKPWAAVTLAKTYIVELEQRIAEFKKHVERYKEAVQDILISDEDASVKEATQLIVTTCSQCGELKLGGKVSPDETEAPNG